MLSNWQHKRLFFTITSTGMRIHTFFSFFCYTIPPVEFQMFNFTFQSVRKDPHPHKSFKSSHFHPKWWCYPIKTVRFSCLLLVSKVHKVKRETTNLFWLQKQDILFTILEVPTCKANCTQAVAQLLVHTIVITIHNKKGKNVLMSLHRQEEKFRWLFNHW